ncbi:MAG: FtsX-like permease family protein [Bacteroidota bacterium]
MKPIIQKLLSDLWLDKGKLILSLMASILAVWGVSSVMYGYLLTKRDFEQNFLASHPADLILTIEGEEDELRETLLQHQGVAQIERREVLTGRIREEDGSWMPFAIFAVKDFEHIRLNHFRILTQLPKQESGFYIEKNAAWFLKENVQHIDWQVPGKGDLTDAVIGYVHDARLPPARMEHMVYGFTTIDHIQPYLPTHVQRYLIGTANPDMNRQELEELGRELRQTVETSGGRLRSLTIPPPGEHPHQNIVDGVSLLQQSLGGILAILGIVLLTLILLAWLYPQMIDIGIMKALGASTRVIFLSYCIVIGCMIGLGLVLGLPAGYATAKGFSGFIAFIQNFEVVQELLPIGPHIWIALLAAVIPFLVSLHPIFIASGINVRAAMSQAFFTPNALLNKWTTYLPTTSRFKYLFNHLFRRPQTTILLMGMISVGFGIFILGSNLRYSIKQDLSLYFEQIDHDLLIYLAEYQQKDLSILTSVPEVASLAYLTTEKVSFHLTEKGYGESRSLKIFPPAYSIHPSLFVHGQAIPECDSCVYINQGLMDDFARMDIGDPLLLTDTNGRERSYQYAGVIKEMGVLPGLYRFSNSPLERYDELVISLTADASLDAASEQIEAILNQQGIVVADIFDVERRLALLEDHLKVSFVTIQLLGAMTLILGLMGIMIFLSLTIEERAREIGILKAIGSSTSQIARLFLDEFLILNGISLVIGFGMSWLATVYLCQLFGEMVLKLGFPPKIDGIMLLLSAGGLILLQLGLIIWRSKQKIRKSARGLLKT